MERPLSFAEAEALAAERGLHRVDQSKSLGHYLHDCWRLRHFTYQYALARIISTTAKNRLGMLWEFLNPLLTAAVYYLAFGLLLGTRRDSENFVLYLIAGMFTWHLFLQSFQTSAMSLLRGKELSQSLLFPRVLIPVASGLQALLRSLPTLSLLYPIAWLTGAQPNWWWLLLPLQLLLTVGFGLGLGLLASRMVSRVRDVAQLLPLLTRMLFFTSGIFFSVEKRFAGAPDWLREIAVNQPTAVLLNLTRGIFLNESDPSSIQLAGVVGATLLVLVAGVLLFWRGERQHG